ncbi:MAG: VWA domain-containing protein [Acidobacteria bacterium]|nr:VWA domain-containing protein [Acidobacteriota bacterium]
MARSGLTLALAAAVALGVDAHPSTRARDALTLRQAQGHPERSRGVSPVEGQQPVFRAGVDLVTFGVTVTDRRGTYIADLTAEDFEIVEDGQPQTIRFFAASGDAVSAPELHVGLLFDTSGSMGEDIKLARTAAVRFLNTLTDAVDITLVDFDTEVRVAKYGQRDFARMVERIRGRQPGGWTAMYDALGVYLDGAQEEDGRTILVVYTDGGDTRSTIAFGDVMTLIRASDVTIFTVGFLEHQSSTTRMLQRARLAQIAEATGGQAFFPSTMKDVEAAYDRILAQIRAQYSLGYASTNTRQNGQWRKVEISLRRPDLRDARILSRRGYFAPYRDAR